MTQSLRKFVPVLAGVSTLAAMGSAHAAIDTAPAVEAITAAGTAVAVIGAAVFLVVIGIKVWKWMSRSA